MKISKLFCMKVLLSLLSLIFIIVFVQGIQSISLLQHQAKQFEKLPVKNFSQTKKNSAWVVKENPNTFPLLEYLFITAGKNNLKIIDMNQNKNLLSVSLLGNYRWFSHFLQSILHQPRLLYVEQMHLNFNAATSLEINLLLRCLPYFTYPISKAYFKSHDPFEKSSLHYTDALQASNFYSISELKLTGFIMQKNLALAIFTLPNLYSIIAKKGDFIAKEQALIESVNEKEVLIRVASKQFRMTYA